MSAVIPIIETSLEFFCNLENKYNLCEVMIMTVVAKGSAVMATISIIF
jgi:hypothetical protein